MAAVLLGERQAGRDQRRQYLPTSHDRAARRQAYIASTGHQQAANGLKLFANYADQKAFPEATSSHDGAARRQAYNASTGHQQVANKLKLFANHVD